MLIYSGWRDIENSRQQTGFHFLVSAEKQNAAVTPTSLCFVVECVDLPVRRVCLDHNCSSEGINSD